MLRAKPGGLLWEMREMPGADRLGEVCIERGGSMCEASASKKFSNWCSYRRKHLRVLENNVVVEIEVLLDGLRRVTRGNINISLL